jgi:hypothetical protein
VRDSEPPTTVSELVSFRAAPSSTVSFRPGLNLESASVGDVIIYPATADAIDCCRACRESLLQIAGPRGLSVSDVLPRAPSSISHPPASFSKPHDTATALRRRGLGSLSLSPTLTAARCIVIDIGAQAAAAAAAVCQRQSTGNSIPAACVQKLRDHNDDVSEITSPTSRHGHSCDYVRTAR